MLKEKFLSPLGITRAELAKALKTSFRTIDEILNSKGVVGSSVLSGFRSN